MTDLFLKTLNMSLSASYLVLAVLVLRLLLRKAPKWINGILWALVGFRLLCPVTLKSILSLIPSAEVISPQIMLDPTPSVQTGIPAVNSFINPIITQSFTPEVGASVNPLQIWLPCAALIWAIGLMGLLGYAAVSYWQLSRRVRGAAVLRENIYQSEAIPSPFVLGIFRPKIYLPLALPEEDREHVIAHEQAHIRRRDHWWKPLGFGLLAIHWFNPLMWLAYILLCRDIELACDEKVVSKLAPRQRADYSQALLNCTVSRSRISACPLAFGEVGVKERIRAVLSYKKPAFWLVLLGLIACIGAAVCFLTDPAESEDFGLRSLRLFGSDPDKFTVTVSYADARGYSVRMMGEDDKEQSGDYLVDYDGALGKYRAQITFLDTQPSATFLERYPPWQVHRLEGVPEDFGAELRLKCAYTPDHGYILYLGSDVPFYIQERSNARLSAPVGNVHFHIERQAALDRLAPGVYIPVYCAYMSPLSSYAAYDLPNDMRYTVTENAFVTEYLKSGGKAENAVLWKWQRAAQAQKALSFGEGTAFAPVLENAELYQKLSDNEHIVKMQDGTLYLIRSGDTKTEYTRIWSVYVIVPEAQYDPNAPTPAQLEQIKDALSSYMVEYRMATLDANELTRKLDIQVYEKVPGLEALVSQYIDLRYVTVSLFEGELRFTATEPPQNETLIKTALWPSSLLVIPRERSDRGNPCQNILF